MYINDNSGDKPVSAPVRISNTPTANQITELAHVTAISKIRT